MVAFEWWLVHLPETLFGAFLLLALRAIRVATPYMRNINQQNLTLRVKSCLHYLATGELNHFHDSEAASLLFDTNITLT